MPTYEYQCKNCGERFEIEQKMTDDPIQIHEKCGGNVVKVFSSAGIVLKGSGFYKTDARSNSKSKTTAPKAKETSKPNSDTKKAGSDSTKTSESKAPKKPESSGS